MPYDQKLKESEQYNRDFGFTLHVINSLIYEKPYSDWTAQWWKWANSIPKEVHPTYDDHGYNCQVNQIGPV
ncbi:hypothetical protein [Candidatus Nitrosocosmicus hydrocola]|uniref:hypothetical protein n=1 Tax=Candidatus Nitrosocosmicus hydrocola TaxID=1826872 RepID=UPI0011E5F04B|nr:hypothetical protein [Candidatus Nitrosocosmicus hydrocola]